MGLNTQLLDKAAACALHTAGGMLNGIVHNLNNPVHALTMQSDLLRNYLAKNIQEPSQAALLEKCARVQRIGHELKEQLDVLVWRDFYTTKSIQLLDPSHFAKWLLRFWENNLFFKHGISVALLNDPPPPHIQVIPLVLLWSLEEPLRAVVTACQGDDPSATLDLRLESGPLPVGGVAIMMSLAPQNGPLELTMVAEDRARDVRDLNASLGWEWRQSRDAGALTVRMSIPGKPGDGRFT